MNERYVIDIYDDYDYYFHDYDYYFDDTELPLEDWGQFIEIDRHDKPYSNYVNNINDKNINDKNNKITENNSSLSLIIIRISSTTFITIGLTYLILSLL